jgi:hypothetical protein
MTPPHVHKGLRDIKTQAGRVEVAAVPHRAYMKLSCLEMERFRKDMERRSALARVAIIDARIEEIDAEKARITEALGAVVGVIPGRSLPVRQRADGGFRLRY